MPPLADIVLFCSCVGLAVQVYVLRRRVRELEQQQVRVVEVPGGEIRIRSMVTDEEMAELKRRWVESYGRGRSAAG